MIKALGLAIFLVAVANVASAGQGNDQIKTIITDVCNDFPKLDGKIDSTALCKGKVITAPEIDAASAMAGMTILLAGLAVVRGRRAKKSKD
ncbi:MAG: hypothetical protein ABSF96_04860 [Steroidobacteraceae bacterium]|jgi:hypothetical protein